MAKILLAVCACIFITEVHSCIIKKYSTCTYSFQADVTAAGYDLNKLCNAMNKVKTCSKEAHCSKYTKAALDAAFQHIPGADPCSSSGVHNKCIISKYSTCASTYQADVTAAGYDLNKLCDAMNKVKSCSKEAHCSDYTKKALDAALQHIPGADPCSSSGVHNKCIISKYSTCASIFKSDVTAAGYDLNKLCSAMNKVETCSKEAHCSEYTKAAMDSALQHIPGRDPCSSSGVHNRCILSKYSTCASSFQSDVTAAGYDLNKLCDAMNKVKTCSKEAHCSDYTKAAMDAALQHIPGADPCSSSGRITYSLALVMFMVLLHMVKRT